MNLSTVKKAFFDTRAVKNAVDPAARKALSKFGAYVRTRARTSIKYKAGTSAPGQPPHAHRSRGYVRKKKSKKTGAVTARPASPLRELIYFAYDPARKSVVVGPTLGGSKSGAPQSLEEGGGATVTDGGRRVHVRVRPRPFMGPAFRVELDKVGGDWRNIITK